MLSEEKLRQLAADNYARLLLESEDRVRQVAEQLQYDRFVRDAVDFALAWHVDVPSGLFHQIGQCELVDGSWICPPDCPVEARG